MTDRPLTLRPDQITLSPAARPLRMGVRTPAADAVEDAAATGRAEALAVWTLPPDWRKQLKAPGSA